jgi:hypothetical protein
MKMSRVDHQQYLGSYVHPEAVLKHALPPQERASLPRPEAEWFLPRLIECVNRPQHQKWRKYAQARSSRTDGAPRMEVA